MRRSVAQRCFTMRWRPHAGEAAAATPAETNASNVSTAAHPSTRRLFHNGPRTASSSVAPTPEWKKRIDDGPGFADFLKSSSVVEEVPSEDDSDDTRRPTPEESLQQIRGMLQQIREAVRMEWTHPCVGAWR